jgi:hypothetical protein
VSSVGGTVTVSGSVSSTVGEVMTGVIFNSGSATAVAKGAVGTITYTVAANKTFLLKQVTASSSGAPCKVVVDYGASPTTVVTGFYSTSSPVFDTTFNQPIPITASTAVRVKITNNSGTAQDVFATVYGIEVP